MTKLSLRLPLLGLAVLVGVGLLLAGSGHYNSPLLSRGTPEPVGMSFSGESGVEVARAPVGPNAISGPVFQVVAAVSFDGDLRQLAKAPASDANQRPELELESHDPLAPVQQVDDPVVQPPYDVLAPAGGMPAPLVSFDGLDHAAGLGGWPPDTNGDVGPNNYIQTVNTAIGIYAKTGGPAQVVTSFNALFSGTGTPCDGNNNGDPVVLYDKGFDRWLVTDFAWTDFKNGPYYECLAASKTNNPVTGGWWFYALRADDATHKFLNDYPKLGVWIDGIYMSANMFDIPSSGSATFEGSRVWALNRTDLFTGAALRVVYFDTNSSVFTLLPSNFRGAAPPAGTANYFVTTDGSVDALDVFKFHVNWASPASSTFTGPTQVGIAAFNDPPAFVPQPPPGNGLDSLASRLMVQNQYKKVGGAESLWLTHSVGVSARAAVRWYQLDVTGGTVASLPVQQSTFSQPGTGQRWMASLAVDRVGDMAIGYSLSSATISPTIAYAGRLFSDTLNVLGQGEGTLIAGTGVQNNTCGGPPCKRWGDYSAMTMDPVDDCTFWYTTEYYDNSDAVAGVNGNWRTRIGSFQFPGCVQVITYTEHVYLPLLTRSVPAPSDGWTTLMQEGFEGVWPSAGWLVSDFASNQRIWGKSNCRASTGSNSAWAIGGGSVGAGLACGASYPNAALTDYMIYGPFSLAGATEANLKLEMLTNLAVGDRACWFSSADGGTFSGFCLTSSTSNTFLPEMLDMTSWLDDPTVWIAIYFETNNVGSVPEGAHVDNLLLRACYVAACSDPSSPSQPAAAGDIVPFSITLGTGAARP